jgi:hypothetical protein
MVEPWLEAGHECTIVDIQHKEGVHTDGLLTRVGADILNLDLDWGSYDIVFCFPPCTDLAVSGAAWFKKKGLKRLIEALTLVERCREICEELVQTDVWFLENPVSTISSYWRKPDYMFHPHQYTGWHPDDNYTKKTCLWCGDGFTLPPDNIDSSLGAPRKDFVMRHGPSAERQNLRSATPFGFAKAVYEQYKGSS